MEFEWDRAMADRNSSKHGVSFQEAATVFNDPLAMTYADPEHSDEEDRYLTFGQSAWALHRGVPYGPWETNANHQCPQDDQKRKKTT